MPLPKRQLNINEMFNAAADRADASAHAQHPVTNADDLNAPGKDADSLEQSSESREEAEMAVFPVDIGLVDNKTITDEGKLRFLENSNKPPAKFVFPTVAGRRFQASWFDKFSWLHYSPELEGGLCAPCVLFPEGGGQQGGRQPQLLRTLVLEPMKPHRKNMEKLAQHAAAHAHKVCMERARLFQVFMHHPDRNITNRLNNAEAAVRAENRKKLAPIVKTVIFCARNNIALRGHRDYGRLQEEDSNDGLFRNLLRFRADSGDEVLKNMIQSTPGNAMYTSHDIQNQLLACCGIVVREMLTKEIRQSGLYSIQVDETCDLGKVEQATIVVRHVDADGEIHEDFLGFVEAQTTTGRGLADLITNFLTEVGLSLDYLRGQGYDGAPAMSGHINGCQALIKTRQPLAVFTHCVNHRLNLVICKACELLEIKNAVDIITRTAAFFAGSAKRTKILEEAHASYDEEMNDDVDGPKSKRRRLVAMCPTRWVERHDSINVFVEMLPLVAKTLQDMGDNEASIILNSIQNPSFIIAIIIANSVLSRTVTLSKALQDPTVDIGVSLGRVQRCKAELGKMRADAESDFGKLFAKAEDLALKVGLDGIRMPRRVGRQVHRGNAPSSSVEEHYRLNIFLPFIDGVLVHLERRFGEDNRPLQFDLQQLMPRHITEDTVEKVMAVAALHSQDLDAPLDVIRGEVLGWIDFVRGEDAVQLDSLKSCIQAANKGLFPSVSRLLRLFGTLPVTNATAERTFSKLRLIKSYLRTTMGQDRLSGLALLYVNRSVEVDPERVMDIFDKTGKRRLKL